MSTLREALNASREGYMLVDKPRPTQDETQSSYYPFVRCSIPPITLASPDSISQFAAIANRAPSQRVVVPNIASASGTTAVINKTSVVSTYLPTSTASHTSSSSSSSDTDDFSPTQTQVSLTTPSLDPNNSYFTTILMAKSFILLSVATNNIQARVELYGTATAQLADAGRDYLTFPNASGADNIISDAVITPSNQYAQPIVNTTGFNGDSPQTTTIYVTVTNFDVVSAPITVTFTYVPMEQ